MFAEERYEMLEYMLPAYNAKPGTKQPRSSSTSNSATSRRNKLQRCSNCGGLGHKSRTCEQASLKLGTEPPSRPSTSSSRPSFLVPDPTQDLTVLAAYGLLSLQAQGGAPMTGGPLQPRPPSQQTQAPPMNAMGAPLQTSPPCSPARLGSLAQQHHWKPLSPRLLAA